MKRTQRKPSIYRIVSILLILVLISAWFLCGLLAKFASSVHDIAQARVATISTLEVYEHEANLEDGVYTLDLDEKVRENFYETVIPGVDIAKDPFIEMTKKTETESYLYVKVIEDHLPNTITYQMATGWTLLSTETEGAVTEKVYVYNTVVGPGFGSVVYLIRNNKLVVSENYSGGAQFKLSFTAYLGQKSAGEDAEDVYDALF